jgi:hypothetical protein
MIRLLLILAASALAAQHVVVQHDYDAVSDAVVSWTLRPGRSVSQGFKLAGAVTVTGFRVKLQRWGEPGPLEYRIGSEPGTGDVASGMLREPVSPWFEHWYGADLSRPVKLKGRYYLHLRLPPGGNGSYEVYGTATREVERAEFHPRFQYIETWYPRRAAPAVFENPANIDYGTRTPSYSGGAAFDSDGEEMVPLDLAFRILGEPGAPASSCEERFSFIEDITGPLYTHSLRDPGAKPGHDEIAIDGGWRLVHPGGELLSIAAGEFREFLEIAMSAKIGSGPRTISVEICSKPAGKPEGFRLTVTHDSVAVCGHDERGAMRGLYHLEAVMRLRRAPFLHVGEEVREPLYSPRITSAPFFSKSELEAPVDQYTAGMLGRIARAGFNAIWVWGDLDEVARSSVYPELDHGVRERQARLNHLIARAARYGIDVYLYLANRPLPEAFYAGHPDVRGSELRAYGGTHILCTSAPEVRRHLEAATRDLMERVPKLRGIVFNVGGEGFTHCYTRKNSCPRCSKRSPQEVIAEFSRAVLAGARAGNPEAAVVLWPYSASNTWSRGDITQSKLLEKLPRGITLLTEFAKEGAISFGGVTIPAYDYPISLVGPSERFLEQAALAKKHGLGFWVKTEHAIALEFVQTPYIPVFFQWAERFRRMREAPGVTGVFANWMHYGFMPSMAADLFYWHIWSQPPDPSDLLGRLARRDFGPGAEAHALRAWKLFSEAIRQYPFSGPMAMGVVQKGPAHPLFFDPNYRPAHGAGRQFTNDLNWTRPWGPELTVRQFTEMERLWSRGVAELERAVNEAAPGLRPNARRELGVAQALLACIRSVIHVGRFYKLRDRLYQGGDPKVLDEMVSVARAELENAQRALPAVCADSRLGYANSGKNDQTGVPRAGIYSPGSIEKKMAQLRRLLDHDIPQYRRAKGWE